MSAPLEWLILLSLAAFVYCWKVKFFQRQRYQHHHTVVANNENEPLDDEAHVVEIAEQEDMHVQVIEAALPEIITRGERPLETFKEETKQLYDQSITESTIAVLPLYTDPSSSVNCTISSAFLVEQHTKNKNALSNERMKQIIDKDPVPAGRDIRKLLGLGPNSALIPSDVFDYCKDNLKMFQHCQFVGKTGGNLFNDIHLNEFFKLLEGAGNIKTGASILHNSNLTTVLKTPKGERGTIVYDFVDTYGHTNSTWVGSCGVRIQCRDLETLRLVMRWNSIRRFQRRDWNQVCNNDFRCDLDIRTFQAFVWRQA